MTQRKPIIFYWMLQELPRFGKGLIAPDLAAAEWIIRGANLGSMNGLPPTLEAIELRGADFICIAESGMPSMTTASSIPGSRCSRCRGLFR